jgi:uncharacterized membrane protein
VAALNTRHEGKNATIMLAEMRWPWKSAESDDVKAGEIELLKAEISNKKANHESQAYQKPHISANVLRGKGFGIEVKQNNIILS